MTQLIWQRRESVSQRSFFDVLKLTMCVEPVGLYESSTALMGTHAYRASRDAARDPFTGHVGQLLVHQLGRVGVRPCRQVVVEPLFGDALELAKQVSLGPRRDLATSCRAAVCQVEEQRGAAHVAQCVEVEIDALADDALIAW
jgi:hypothetical protein